MHGGLLRYSTTFGGASCLVPAFELKTSGPSTGDDAVMDAAFRQMGIQRVDTLEELIVTAHVLGQKWRPRGNRMRRR